MALKDEILAAIAAKIEGQGTAVDAGSALPGILRGIIEYVDGIAAGIPAAQIQSDWNQSNNTKVDFIKNKPTIPAAQIQSDWSQADNTKLDFIKNKPTIPAGIKTITLASWDGTELRNLSKSEFAAALGCTEAEVDEIFANNVGQLVIYIQESDLGLLKSVSVGNLGAFFGSITESLGGFGCSFSRDQSNLYFASYAEA